MGMSEIVVATGANSRFFLMACLLMQSLKNSGLTFYVCDFGLSTLERQFFAGSGSLLEMPLGNPRVANGAHPWVLKTELGSYFAAAQSWSKVTWIDADIVVADLFSQMLRALSSQMDREGLSVAAAAEGTFSDILGLKNLDLEPFLHAVEARRISTSTPYFNAGFVVFNSRSVLDEWASVAGATRFHALYDQNILNLILASSNKVLPLKQELWNIRGSLLANSSPDAIVNGATPRGLVFHATSPNAADLERFACAMPSHATPQYEMRLFTNPYLRSFQFKLIDEFIAENQMALQAMGISVAGIDGRPPHCLSTQSPIRFCVPRNRRCPCQSGERYKHCHGASNQMQIN